LKRKAEQASVGNYEDPQFTKKSRIVLEGTVPYINLVRPPPGSFGYLCLTDFKSPPHFIQRLMENKRLPYSVQWELARLVSKGILHWDTSIGGRAIKFEEIDSLRPSDDSKNPHSECLKKVHDIFLSGDNGSKVIAFGSNSFKLSYLYFLRYFFR